MDDFDDEEQPRRRRQNRLRIKFVYGEMTLRQEGWDLPSMRRYIANVGQRARDLSPIFGSWVSLLFAREQQVFSAEGIPRWPELAPAYKDWKDQHFPGQRILSRTGTLEASLTEHTPQTIIRIGPRSMHFGTRVPYSGPLQEGSFRGAMGPRPHVVMFNDDFEEMSAIAMAYIANGQGRRV